jgi:predicted metal-binding protein
MERFVLLGCKNNMDTACIGCSPCLAALNKRGGGFTPYNNTDVELVGMVSCGGCPGTAAIPRLYSLALWTSQFEKPTKIYLGPCIIKSCPYGEKLIDKVRAMAGIEVVNGSHLIELRSIFA